jgi:Acyclic terpene utilisation family protein AtuA
LLECGAQATGGTFTDWMDVPEPDNIGFPIAECRADGTFALTKTAGSGGLVSVGTVAEQLLYEVSNPAAYYVPDVACDFTSIRMRETAPNRVEITDVHGNAPNGSYKVSGLIEDGWRTVALIPVFGSNAEAKAKRVTESLLDRSRRVLEHAGLPAFRQTHVELLGTGDTFAVGEGRNSQQTEVIGRVAVIHDDVKGATIFRNESLASPTNACPGMVPLGLPTVGPVHRLFSFLMPRNKLRAKVTVGDKAVEMPPESAHPAPGPVRPAPVANTTKGGGEASVPLIALAWGRSGDKGNLYNVGVIARRPEYFPHIRTALTEAYVAKWLLHTFDSPSVAKVARYDLPGLNALNFVMHEALGGGGSLQLRLDCFAKSMGQTLLQIPIPVPRGLAARWDGSKLLE